MNRPSNAEGHRVSSDRRWLLWSAAILLGIVPAVFALIVVDFRSDMRVRIRYPAPSVAFETTRQADADSEAFPATAGRALRVAVAPVVSPETSIRLYKGLVSYLGGAVGRKGLMVQRSSYSEINSLLRHGQCDVAFVCTRAYVEGKRDFDLQILAAPVVGGATSYRSDFIVRKDSPAETILDMKGTRLASADVLSNTGFLYPEFFLLREGQRIHAFFSEIIFTQGHDRAMRAVASGVADFAAVDNLVLEQVVREHPALGAAVRVIHKSPEFGMPPLVAPRDIEPELLVRLRRALLEMHTTAEGRAALEPLGFQRFRAVRDDDYDTVRKMVLAIEDAK